METQKITPGKFGVNYGLILGGVMILIGVIMYVTDMALEGKQWPQYLYYIIFPAVIFYAISKYRSHNAGNLSLSEALKVGMVIAVVSALVYVVYGLIFNYVIDPEFTEKMIKVAEDKVAESGLSPEVKQQQMEWIERFSNPVLGFSFWIALSAIFGLIYSLIGGLVMKRDNGS